MEERRFHFLVTFDLCKPLLPSKAKSGMRIVGSNHYVSWDNLKGEDSKQMLRWTKQG
jgi:hypothetical protein